VVLDPARAGLPVSPGSLQWGGVYGHHWFMDLAKKITLVGLTNTTLEGMSGQFTLDLKKAVAADL
jgi:CubicO group peptidase (beta-lactamase class C family)